MQGFVGTHNITFIIISIIIFTLFMLLYGKLKKDVNYITNSLTLAALITSFLFIIYTGSVNLIDNHFRAIIKDEVSSSLYEWIIIQEISKTSTCIQDISLADIDTLTNNAVMRVERIKQMLELKK